MVIGYAFFEIQAACIIKARFVFEGLIAIFHIPVA
jgi:hypothetical protein